MSIRRGSISIFNNIYIYYFSSLSWMIVFTVEQYCPVTVTVESIIIVIYFTTQNSCRHRCCAVVVATAVLLPFSCTKIILFPNITSQFLHLHLESLRHSIVGIILFTSSFVAVVVRHCLLHLPCQSTINSDS